MGAPEPAPGFRGTRLLRQQARVNMCKRLLGLSCPPALAWSGETRYGMSPPMMIYGCFISYSDILLLGNLSSRHIMSLVQNCCYAYGLERRSRPGSLPRCSEAGQKRE